MTLSVSDDSVCNLRIQSRFKTAASPIEVKKISETFKRLIRFRTLLKALSTCKFQNNYSSSTRPRSLWLSTLFIAVQLWVIRILCPSIKRASQGLKAITMDSLSATFKAIPWFSIHDEMGYLPTADSHALIIYQQLILLNKITQL